MFADEKRECEIEELEELRTLVRELFEILDLEEETAHGVPFHPTYINSCRVMHCDRLDVILPKMKQIVKGDGK